MFYEKSIVFYQNKDCPDCVNAFVSGIVVHDADRSQGSKAEEEAVYEAPPVADAEQGGAGGDVAQDKQ